MAEKVNEQGYVRVDYLPQLNYASWLNGQQCLRRVEVDNQSGNDWKDVTVSLGGDLHDESWQATKLPRSIGNGYGVGVECRPPPATEVAHGTLAFIA